MVQEAYPGSDMEGGRVMREYLIGKKAKSNMEMTVSFLAGTSFQDACEGARGCAIRNNLAYVKFDFNGIHIAISQRADVDKAYEKFLEAPKEGAKCKWVIA